MKDAATLLALADKVASLKAPDPAIGLAIAELDYRSGGHLLGVNYDAALWMERNGIDPTASIDAAMALMPKGWDWMTGTNGTGGGYAHCVILEGQIIEEQAATPALALAAAALRAHAAIAGEG